MVPKRRINIAIRLLARLELNKPWDKPLYTRLLRITISSDALCGPRSSIYMLEVKLDVHDEVVSFTIVHITPRYIFPFVVTDAFYDRGSTLPIYIYIFE